MTNDEKLLRAWAIACQRRHQKTVKAWPDSTLQYRKFRDWVLNNPVGKQYIHDAFVLSREELLRTPLGKLVDDAVRHAKGFNE